MIGHIVGSLSEIPTRYLCSRILNMDNIACSVIAYTIHEAIIEPVTDGVIYGALGGLTPALDPARIAASVLGSCSFNFFSYALIQNDNIFLNIVQGMLGGYVGSQMYDYVYDNN